MFVRAIAFVVFCVPVPAGAQEIDLHMSGASFGEVTDGNPFRAGRTVPDVGRLELVINTSARALDDRVSVEAQLFTSRESSENDSFVVQVDYALGTLRISDGLQLRVGAPKLPFGLLNETRNVAVLRILPDIAGAYGNLGFLNENYQGLGVTGRGDAGPVFLTWDAYGGWTNNTYQRPWYGVTEYQTPALAGGRVLAELPWPGVIAAASLALTIDASLATGQQLSRVLIGLSGELRDDLVTLRSEVFLGHESVNIGSPDVQLLQSYLEAGVRPLSWLELAVRGEFAGARVLNEAPQQLTLGPTGPDARRHLPAEIGATWWPDPHLAVRLSASRIYGNLHVNGYGRDGRVVLPADELAIATTYGQLCAAFAF